ncbi:alpha/beta fold hydrolase [Bdellovibrio bacteriovorus]|uniref:Alpha/beta hydrolase n=1 Tax=Bdellovibrio bacteriovorus TaxID=959 RepID=A0A1Z3N3L0_BDEBC|nr:alpha/beta hydrolase [Bdellovibrio bacteriovorus]ASD62056.1 alpha/beta hydrolase [Bdellovibrio bacteriovorus]
MDTTPKTTGSFESFDGTPIYYEVRGEGEPLVLVYGIACLLNHWHHQIEYFSKKYQVISFDLRGHQKSCPVADVSQLTVDALSKDIIGLMAHLNIRKAHFAGHSFGAPLLLDLYEKKPELFLSMVFINGFAKNPIKGMFGLDVVEPFFYFVKSQYENQPDVWNTLWKLAVDNPMSMYIAALAGGFNLKVTHFKDIEVYARGVARMNLEVFLRLFEELMKYDGEPVLEKIEVPVLIISGEKDMVTPIRFQYHFKEKIKHSEFVLVPYGSHCTQLDFPDYTNLKIEKFLLDVKEHKI